VIASLSAVFGQAAFHGLRDQDSRSGTKFGEKKSGEKKNFTAILRLPFTDGYQKNVSAPIVHATQSASKAAQGEAGFWIPMIALSSGMRLEGICQLHVAGVMQIPGIDLRQMLTFRFGERTFVGRHSG
jgi:hypothetical protein